MGKFFLAYHGGEMGESEAEQQQIMTRWMTWFGTLGPALVDAGNPFGPATTLVSEGTVPTSGRDPLGGYSIISADSLEAACNLARGCPLLAAGGEIDIYEAHPIA